MKAYLHIANGSYFCHKKIMTEIEIDGAPQKGAVFYMNERTQEYLEKKIKEFNDKAREKGFAYDYMQLESEDGTVDLDEYFYVKETAWITDETEKYRLHIELTDENPLK